MVSSFTRAMFLASSQSLKACWCFILRILVSSLSFSHLSFHGVSSCLLGVLLLTDGREDASDLGVACDMSD
eukprot:768157-Hanusia_phi.AAC.5